MALECTLSALGKIDQTDPVAVQNLLRSCIHTLLDPTLWEWAIVLTLACAAVGAAIGWIRGRWLAGLVWGAALGPIGWLVIALSKAGLGECPECGHRNQPDARVCHRCGIDIRRTAGQSPRSRLKAQDRARRW
jgi:ribosomal protein L32